MSVCWQYASALRDVTVLMAITNGVGRRTIRARAGDGSPTVFGDSSLIAADPAASALAPVVVVADTLSGRWFAR
jgi:hypothetical protein